MSVSSLIETCRKLEVQVFNELHEANVNKVDNIRRRVLYSDLELIRLDIFEAALEEANSTNYNKAEADETYARIDELLKLLKLVPIKRPRQWWSPLEVILRFIAVSTSFMLVGSFCSLPLLLMRAVDQMRQADAFNYWSETFKRKIAWYFLFQSGIDATVEGLDRASWTSSCVLMTFTHASNLDGFLVAGTCPIRQLAFGKKELFVVPFFRYFTYLAAALTIIRLC